MPPPWTDCRHPDPSSMGMTNGINEVVWDKLCFKTAAHGGQKAVKTFTGSSTTSSRGRGSHTGIHGRAPRRCSGQGASFGKDYLALSHRTDSITGGVHWQPAQVHPAPCWLPEN